MHYEDKFTERAKRVINLAQDAAGELGHSYVGSEHILLGLIREESGIAAKTLSKYGLDNPKITKVVVDSVGKGEPGAQPSQGLTPRTKRIIERAGGEAARLNVNYIGTEHLLMAMLREHDSIGARIIGALGVDLNKLYTELTGGKPPQQQSGGQPPQTPGGQGPAEAGNNGFIVHGPFHVNPNSLGGLFAGMGAPNGGPPPGSPVWQQINQQHPDSATPTLDRFSRDLTAMASEGKLDPVIGRDEEVQRIIQILSRRTKNNPVLIGEPGVGKTAVVEGLAQKIIAGNVPEDLRGRRIVMLDLAAMVAGTKYRGEFEERIKDTMDEVLQSHGMIILFLDELHTVIGAGSAEGTLDASNIIKPALSRGEVQVIGATTIDEYRKHVERDRALERRFQTVKVDEPTQEDSILILQGLKDRYEAHHKLSITDEAIEAAVKMSARYITDRFLPDKAIDLVDEACSRVRMQSRTVPPDLKELEEKLEKTSNEKDEAVRGQDFERAAALRDQESKLIDELKEKRERWANSEVTARTNVIAEDIAAVVGSWTGVPVTSLTQDDSARLLDLENILHKRVVSQDEAVRAVSKAIRRGRVGLKDPKRPTGSFLFLGPTGVGKTELCRALAEALFGDEAAMIKVDMSEFMEKHTVSKLIGSPPGYVGYDEGGQLTEKVRRKPYSVILFDEIEKAHPDVFNIMLQIMEDGVLTDGQGHRIDFKNAVIVMTSNIGAKSITDDTKPLGFNVGTSTGEKSYEEIKKSVTAELKKMFRPEFLNRIDDVIVFSQLSKENIREIANNMLREIAKRVAELNITLESEDEAVDLLAATGYDPVYGARPLRRAIQSAVEDGIAEKMLDGSFLPGDTVILKAIDGKAELVKGN
ncbi:MAG: ATP-dependent Clp protease ATP-binding subunit [Oscillospiraceae bacterium]|jgi:ATP-dependent Clp protease ATP-binding subunit ClpC|nr:ATP-dependent Clp protease ATP-binding subunit [Oscillospiraceae bacterium]